MDNDPNQPQSSSYGQQLPLYESQPPDGQPQYGGSPIPNYWPPQQPKKRSSRWPWITLAILGGLIALGCIGSAIFVALSIGIRPLSTNVANLNDDRPGSLRQIIANAMPGSTITFDKSLHGTIRLYYQSYHVAGTDPTLDLPRELAYATSHE